ncbi:MAG: TolC family protein [Bdellovibrionota bacterium]
MKQKYVYQVGAIALTVLLYTTMVWAEVTYSLDQMIDHAITNSSEIAASQTNHQVVAAQKEQLQASQYPQATVSETFLYTNDPVGVFGNKLRKGEFSQSDFGLNQLNDPDPTGIWWTRLQVQAPIWTGGRVQANKEILHTQDASIAKEIATIESNIRVQVSKMYYQWQSFDEQIAVIDSTIEKLFALERSYALMDAPTSATKTSFLISQAVRISMQAEKQNLQTQRALMIQRLRIATNLDLSDDLLAGELPKVGQKMIYDQPQYKRHDYKVMLAKLEIAEKKLDASSKTNMPALHSFASYNLYTGTFDTIEGAFDVGATLQWTFANSSQKHQVKEAKAHIEKLKHMIEAKKKEIQASQINAVTMHNDSIKQYALITSAMQKVDQALSVAEKRYKEGTLPLKDLSQAIQEWTAIASQKIQTQLQVSLTTVQYQYEIGEL